MNFFFGCSVGIVILGLLLFVGTMISKGRANSTISQTIEEKTCALAMSACVFLVGIAGIAILVGLKLGLG